MTAKAPTYPKGDLRRMLAVLAAIDALGPDATLVKISALSSVDKKTVGALIGAAVAQAGMTITKDGPTYSIESWGPVIAKKGAKLALTGALNAPIVNP
ncbi:hypothetical protein AACH06_25505 [Ideonella sp. DXS29W]|uniref:Uncharacterized protein n=1 Tax=Ideonella lacteola TaxID=2984193 RepID=A0ABU9BW44_9BURK